ncbi:hypothetical protein SAMN05216548_113125 [Faunimonas pinastri]|uniref:Uncharacterized protein n=1 Tax=Faunimonas pinastri TaxID=1855383 RepID=A0A1H9MJJ6_9HYPH|nr:hypothetical protein [Faunimonas pinastri]SER23333.1 hypothetical protein SAMN05216548_113125 [Faunimonas pinastri]
MAATTTGKLFDPRPQSNSGRSSTDVSVEWLKNWAASHVTAPMGEGAVSAETLAKDVEADAVGHGLYLKSAMRALGYKNLVDFMLDELEAADQANA